MDPPLQKTYMRLSKEYCSNSPNQKKVVSMSSEEIIYCEPPLIDMKRLAAAAAPVDRERCIKEMAEAARQWGLFQVKNHGFPQEVLKRIREEEMEVFHESFRKKSEGNFLNLSANSYRWGNPHATCLRHFFWSEAFHIPLSDIPSMTDQYKGLRSIIEVFAEIAYTVARCIAEILADEVGAKSINFFEENCTSTSCYVRLNRYPPCPFSSEVYGMVPHTDSDFLTILYQDQVGGLQFRKDGRWFCVKPNPEALIINIGDLFQAFSNGVYKSTEHRVIAPQKNERFSVAFFYCPSDDAVIQSCSQPPIYRNFTFKEYRQQNHKDLQATGAKAGLLRFLL